MSNMMPGATTGERPNRSTVSLLSWCRDTALPDRAAYASVLACVPNDQVTARCRSIKSATEAAAPVDPFFLFACTFPVVG
jgi:hypothetical protein